MQASIHRHLPAKISYWIQASRPNERAKYDPDPDPSNGQGRLKHRSCCRSLELGETGLMEET